MQGYVLARFDLRPGDEDDESDEDVVEDTDESDDDSENGDESDDDSENGDEKSVVMCCRARESSSLVKPSGKKTPIQEIRFQQKKNLFTVYLNRNRCQ